MNRYLRWLVCAFAVLCIIYTPLAQNNKFTKFVFSWGFGFWFLLSIAEGRRRFFNFLFTPTPLRVPLAAFLGAVFLSVLLSSDFHQSQGIFFDRYVMFACFFFWGAGMVVRFRRSLTWGAWLVTGWATVFGAAGLWDYFANRANPALVERIWMVFGMRIPYYGLPLYLTFYLPLCLFVALFARTLVLRLVAAAGVTLLSACLLLNASRIAWAAVLISAAAAVFVCNKKQLVRAGIFVCLLLAATLAHPAARERFKTMPNPAQWSNRVPLYSAAFKMFRDHPLTGAGLGTYQTLLHTPRYELPSAYPVPKELNLHAHNTYLELAAETGIIGLLAFVCIFGIFFVLTAVRARAAGDAAASDERAFTYGIAASVLAVLVFAMGSTIITVGPTVSTYFWFLLGAGSGALYEGTARK